jgi:hypothetical protein
VDGQADRAARVGDAAGDGLTYPPGGVGGELEALAPVELLDGVHQAQVALLDEVEEGQPGGLVLLGDGDDQAQVRLDERALGVHALGVDPAQLAAARLGDAGALPLEVQARLVPGLDGLGQADLVVLGEQGVLPDVREVEPDEVFLIPLDTLLGQFESSFLWGFG